MELMDVVCSRKSVRSYTGEKVSEKTLQKILKAGEASPVGGAQYDTLHFTVIEDASLLHEIDTTAAKVFGNPSIKPLYGAPTFILISSSGELGNVNYSNAAIAAHNMSLAAVEEGAGQCLIWGAIRAINQSPEILKKLNLPEGFTPCCGVIVGKTNESYSARQIPEDRIKTNRI